MDQRNPGPATADFPVSAVVIGALLWILAHAAASSHVSEPSCDPLSTPTVSGVERVEIATPASHWQDHGFVEMVPAIRLPTSQARDDMIRVYLRLPGDRKITAHGLGEQQRPTLVYPPGTEAARVESLRFKDPNGTWRETVVDVRGTRIREPGRQHYYALRPESGAPQAPLAGWSWPAADPVAQQQASCKLQALARQAGGPLGRPPMRGSELDELRTLNQCGSCHTINHRRELSIEHAPMPRRETDSAGFFTPLSVLNDHAPMAATRPLDTNICDRLVSVRCDGQSARLVQEAGWTWYRCPDDRVPVGHRDTRTGLQNKDAYTQAVCASRRYLHDHMEHTARRLFAGSFQACGITSPQAR